MAVAKLWRQCMLRLEGELSSADLATYIRPLHPVREEGRLVLLAPNAVVQRRVRDTYLAALKRIVHSVAGEKLAVEVEVGASRDLNGEESAAAEDITVPRGTSRLDPRYSFDTFIEGKSNAQARAAAQHVAEAPGAKFNPLLIYGDSGLGKTHLMHAIGNSVLRRNAKARVIYIPAERFVRDFVSALRHGTSEDFKAHYRMVDALLIDDIHFFVGKSSSQEEFFHTFNELLDSRQQMVLTCDRYPEELEGLDKRLRSRFAWGLAVPVEPPELETRVAILLSKAAQAGVHLSQDVAFFVAQRVRANVRQLEGALNRLFASAQITGRPISVDFARETLKDMLAAYERLITVDNIKRTVCEYYNIRVGDLGSKSRRRSLARPRQVAMSLARELTQHSLPEIGEAFGGRDHTTVLHACKQIKELRQTDTRIREDYENLMRQLSY